MRRRRATAAWRPTCSWPSRSPRAERPGSPSGTVPTWPTARAAGRRRSTSRSSRRRGFSARRSTSSRARSSWPLAWTPTGSRRSARPDFALGVNVAWLSHDGLEEFIAFQNVVQGEGGITLQVVARGCLDTAPTAFPAGTRVWFISYGSQVVNIRGPVPPTVNVYNDIRLQPYNNQSEYNFSSCPTSQVVATTPARSEKVYCPTDVRFNGRELSGVDHGRADRVLVAPESARDVELCRTRARRPHRSREPSTTSWSTGSSTRSSTPSTGLTGTSWTYLEATEIAESGLGRLNGNLRTIMRTWGLSRTYEARATEWAFYRV